MTDKANIGVIVFDLGGVLVELGSEPVPSEWLPGNGRFELSDWFASATAKSFEKGMIGPRQFAEGLQRDLAIDASVEDIVRHFTDWPTGVFAGAHEILDALAGRQRLALLSNTNELHWPRIENEFGLTHYFERVFASHLLKLAKPDPEIYRRVIDELRVKPADIVFLDDNPANVDAAGRLGMRACQVEGIEQVRKLLIDIGAL